MKESEKDLQDSINAQAQATGVKKWNIYNLILKINLYT